MHIQVYEYEKGSNEISSYYRTYVVNNVLEVHMIDTKDKYTDSFRRVLVNNIYHRFDHVWMINRQEQYSISYDYNVGRTTVIWVVI